MYRKNYFRDRTYRQIVLMDRWNLFIDITYRQIELILDRTTYRQNLQIDRTYGQMKLIYRQNFWIARTYRQVGQEGMKAGNDDVRVESKNIKQTVLTSKIVSEMGLMINSEIREREAFYTRKQEKCRKIFEKGGT